MNRLRCKNNKVAAVTGVWRFPHFRQGNAAIKFQTGHIFVHSLSFTVMLPLDYV